jgi:hypothetical protein
VGEGKLRATEFQAFTAVSQMQVRLFVAGSHPISSNRVRLCGRRTTVGRSGHLALQMSFKFPCPYSKL